MLPDYSNLFDRPIIILAAPRSGSTLLFETLAEAREVWTIGGESHQIIEGLRVLNPNFGRVDSNRLTEVHAGGQIATFLRSRFARFLKDRDGGEFFHPQASIFTPSSPDPSVQTGCPQGKQSGHEAVARDTAFGQKREQGGETHQPRRVRFLEKTPKNSLRVPFLDQVFPGALFIFLFRDVRANLSSMMEAWRSGRWVTYPQLQGWQGPPWSLLLPPGWHQLAGQPLEEICAYQWNSANRTILDDLQKIPRQRWTAVGYQDLLDAPLETVRNLCAFADLQMDDRLRARLQQPLPLSRLTQTRPDANKWRKNEKEITSVMGRVVDLESRMHDLGYKRAD